MRNTMQLEQNAAAPSAITAEACPYFDIGDTCGAAISSALVGWKRKLVFCTTEDHDDCPMFISKVLREGSFRNLRQ
jgi:hypothetical protein